MIIVVGTPTEIFSERRFDSLLMMLQHLAWIEDVLQSKYWLVEDAGSRLIRGVGKSELKANLQVRKEG